MPLPSSSDSLEFTFERKPSLKELLWKYSPWISCFIIASLAGLALPTAPSEKTDKLFTMLTVVLGAQLTLMGIAFPLVASWIFEGFRKLAPRAAKGRLFMHISKIKPTALACFATLALVSSHIVFFLAFDRIATVAVIFDVVLLLASITVLGWNTYVAATFFLAEQMADWLSKLLEGDVLLPYRHFDGGLPYLAFLAIPEEVAGSVADKNYGALCEFLELLEEKCKAALRGQMRPPGIPDKYWDSHTRNVEHFLGDIIVRCHLAIVNCPEASSSDVARFWEMCERLLRFALNQAYYHDVPSSLNTGCLPCLTEAQACTLAKISIAPGLRLVEFRDCLKTKSGYASTLSAGMPPLLDILKEYPRGAAVDRIFEVFLDLADRLDAKGG